MMGMHIGEDKSSIIVRVWPDESWAIVEDINDGEYGRPSGDFLHVDLYDPCAESKLNPRLFAEIVEAVIGPDPQPVQAWLDARDAEFDDRWNARMNP